MKKKIGISFTRTNFENYWNWFAELEKDNDLELVLLSFENPDLESIRQCDGLVLTGGVDIDPALYQATPGYPNQPASFEPERDRFETEIYLQAKNKRIPLLAICRGMQLVHVLEGGKLIQDLGPNNQQHKKDTLEDKQHPVVLEPGSRLFDWVKSSQGMVNSAHHQAIDPDSLADSWRISARDESGLIEAIEWKDTSRHPFLVGVQWHPERMINKLQNPLSWKIRDQFLQII